MQIQLLMTGSELMCGTTTDTNSVRIADALAALGLAVHRKVTIGDDFDLLVQEIQKLSKDSNLLIINGGLGPTSDDLTAAALAHATNDTLIENTEALQHLAQWCSAKKIPLDAANRKQVQLPQHAFLLKNTIGSAYGFGVQLNRCLILCTPGVPRELEHMLADEIIPLLSQQFPHCEQQHILRLHLFGIGESQAQDLIDKTITQWPAGITLGFRAGMPTVEIKLLTTKKYLPQAQQYFAQLKTLLADYIVAEGDNNLASSVLNLLAAQNKTLTCAESCTGGLIATMLTEISGASRVFTAGFITYSNAMKQALLGVSEKTLQAHGAVSEQTVREMAAGALQRSGASYAVAVSGIAGPDGGTAEKPVGTVWIAWGSQDSIRAQCFQLGTPRKRCQQLSAAIALDLIRRSALQESATPPYFSRWAASTQRNGD